MTSLTGVAQNARHNTLKTNKKRQQQRRKDIKRQLVTFISRLSQQQANKMLICLLFTFKRVDNMLDILTNKNTLKC